MRSTRTLKTTLIMAPTLALAAACGREQPRVDDALRNDLTLATQAQRYPQNQYVNPAELGYGQPQQYVQTPYGLQPVQPGYAQAGYYAAPAPAPAPVRERVVYRTRTASAARSSGGGGGTYSSAGTYDAGAAERKRQRAKGRTNGAIIGSVAGAAIGVATSGKSDRLKGGLIGAVAGGALGTVIGNNQGKLPF